MNKRRRFKAKRRRLMAEIAWTLDHYPNSRRIWQSLRCDLFAFKRVA